MIKKLLVSSFYAFIVFSVVSYISVMYSLLQSVINPQLKPVTNIGFPFKYYFQFWVSGSDAPNCGWAFNYFIYDVAIIWVLTTLFYVLILRRRAHNNR